MKKYTRILLVILLFMFSLNTAKAQFNIFVGPIVGGSISAGDYGGKPPDYYTTVKYGQKGGYIFGAMGTATLKPVDLRVAVTYSIIGTNGLSDETHLDSFVDVTQHLITVSLGTQYGINIPHSLFKPYIGVDLLYSSLSGSADFLNTTTLSNPTQTIKMNAASREGLGFAVGTDFKVNKKITLDFSIRYNMINLFGKKYESPANANRDNVYSFLNDAKDPNYNPNDPNHPVGNDRNIVAIQIQLAVLFGFKL
jgi:opacity protein-like surface antigen